MNTSKTLLSKISNTIFLIISTIVLVFIWINYYIKDIEKSFLSSIIITFVICLAFFSYKKYKNKREISKNNSLEQIQFAKDQLLFGKTIDTIAIISKLYNHINLKPTNQEYHHINISEQIDYYFLFKNEQLTQSDFINIYQTRQFNKIIVYCFNETTFTMFENIDIKTITFDNIYKKSLEQDTPLTNNIKSLKKPKLKAKEILGIVFNKNRSKGYLYFGLMIIFSSFFTIFSIYYLIVGSCLIFCSIFSRFNKIYN